MSFEIKYIATNDIFYKFFADQLDYPNTLNLSLKKLVNNNEFKGVSVVSLSDAIKMEELTDLNCFRQGRNESISNSINKQVTYLIEKFGSSNNLLICSDSVLSPNDLHLIPKEYPNIGVNDEVYFYQIIDKTKVDNLYELINYTQVAWRFLGIVIEIDNLHFDDAYLKEIINHPLELKTHLKEIIMGVFDEEDFLNYFIEKTD